MTQVALWLKSEGKNALSIIKTIARVITIVLRTPEKSLLPNQVTVFIDKNTGIRQFS